MRCDATAGRNAMNRTKALIAAVTGHDGAILPEFPLRKDSVMHGIKQYPSQGRIDESRREALRRHVVTPLDIRLTRAGANLTQHTTDTWQ
jgi:GDP-D-mannose dehydratase